MDDYKQGMQDCENSITHESGKSAEYDAGYSDQYTLEQMEDKKSEANSS